MVSITSQSRLGHVPTFYRRGISVLHELVDVALEIIQKLSGHVSLIIASKLHYAAINDCS